MTGCAQHDRGRSAGMTGVRIGDRGRMTLGFYRVIPRVVAESRNSGFRLFCGHFWMLRLRAA